MIVRATSNSVAASDHPWDNAAKGWNDHTQIIREWLREATPRMLDAAHLTTGSRVLDIAAGAGDQTLDIAIRVGENGHVLATDISSRILELAQHNASAEGFSQIETRVADAQSLGLDGANFDAAVCRLGLMFCNQPLAALSSARTALKPGGRFSALVFSGPQNNPCLAIMMRIALERAGMKPGTPSSPFVPGTLMSLGKPGLLAELLRDAGFVDVNVQPVAAPFRLPTSRHYIEFVRSAGSPIMQILAPLTDTQQADAWNEMETRLNAFSTPGGWIGSHELLQCTATVPDAD
jgi:SAM-dependent methyltransferase